jgi:riboflavin synthase
MFTGIIERTARVVAVTPGAGFNRLIVTSDADDVAHGESIAINGVCLTVAERAAGELHFDVIAETLSKTNLGLLKQGDSVHLERSLRVGDRISGHFVQGHIDGPATLVGQKSAADEVRLRLQVPTDLSPFVAPKGSVTLDGVSLTVAALDGCFFEVALIPITVALTNLLNHPPGYPYNFEADILSKTIVAYLARQRA